MINVGRWFGAETDDRRHTKQNNRRTQGRMRLTSLRPNSCFVLDNDPAARRLIVNAVESRGAVCTELAAVDELFDALGRFVPSLIFLEM